MAKIKILIVIERRADYSRFRPIIRKLKEDPFFELYLIVTGSCLLEQHGLDIQYMENEEINIHSKIEMFKENAPDTGGEMVRAIGRILGRLVDELEKVRPHIVLSGFDIGANFAVTIAAAHMNIPVAHIQGGEVSGSIDESLRHAMSKFAHIHFPATEEAKERLIRMGENPKNIFVVGCPSIDEIIQTRWISDEAMEREFGIDLSKPLILLIQHPVTTEISDSRKQIEETLGAIEEIGEQTIALLPNNDAGYSEIFKGVKGTNLKYFTSLSTLKFVNLYRHVSVLVGNSSSGIHEAATLKIPVVNIGSRQQGRMRPENVIDVGYDKNEIKSAIQKVLYDSDFRERVKNVHNPYGDGKSAERIVKILKEIEMSPDLIQKRFYTS